MVNDHEKEPVILHVKNIYKILSQKLNIAAEMFGRFLPADYMRLPPEAHAVRIKQLARKTQETGWTRKRRELGRTRRTELHNWLLSSVRH